MTGDAYRRLWAVVPHTQRRMISLLALALLAANLWQPYPEIAPLQHVPTVMLLLAAPWLLARWPLSDAAVGSVLAFFLLHTFAGRWTYSNVPYDAWGRALTGQSIDAAFGWSRNNFDRLVHLAFGVCSVRPVAEAMRRYGGVSWRMGLWTAFLVVGAVSALYEVFEWLLTVVLAGGMAEDYNGQQGDMWDAQKDMGIAMLGACGAIVGNARRGT